jgi:hypothetical protein
LLTSGEKAEDIELGRPNFESKLWELTRLIRNSPDKENSKMGKADEYRANAAECRRMAESTKNQREKSMWQDMCRSWLGLIGRGEREDFASEEHQLGTKQSKSDSSH